MFDYLIVGAGFAGAVVAEQMASSFGKKVMVVDRRPHVAGNAFDHLDAAGILVHKYGPHIFHTNSDDVFTYLSKFTKWRQYEHKVLASVNGKLVPVPINLDTVNLLYDLNLDEEGVEQFFAERAEPARALKTSEDVVVSRVGRDLYEKMFQGYTRKQWGLDPSQLDASVISRIPIRTNRDDRYFGDKHQVMPLDGYTRMFERILDHPNITVAVGTDYRDIIDEVQFKELVYSGPVDEYFDYRFGKLPYRSLRFEHETHNLDQYQPVSVVNYPDATPEEACPYTRITEFKKLTGQTNSRTSIVYEYPTAEGDPYYPIPRAENAVLYKKYEALANATPNVHFVGRLGTYKYYNMDQVVAQALTLCSRVSGASRQALIAS